MLPSVQKLSHSLCLLTLLINVLSPVSNYTGVRLTGGVETTASNAITASNIINDYSHVFAIDPNDSGLLFRCVTGLGPTSNNNADTGELYFNNELIPHGECNGPVVQSRGATISNFVGVINVFLCERFTTRQEGVYTCTMRNSDMVDESVRVGVYLLGRSKLLSDVRILPPYHCVNIATPVITTATSSTVNVVIGISLTLSCTSEGSPPDIFTWIKDGVPITQSSSISITAVNHNNNKAVFRSDYTISRVTTSDSGIYTCNVTNPIGSDSHSITVIATDSTGEYIIQGRLRV